MIRFSILCLILFTHFASAQNADTVSDSYVERYPNKFFVWPLLKKRGLSFEVKDRSVPNSTIRYKPNNSFSAGIGVYLFEIAAELSFAIPVNEKNEATYGNTNSREFHINMLTRSWGVDGFSQKYFGFYFNNPSKNQKPEVIKRPDIELSNLGVNGIYVFNKNKFSLRSSYNYSERQLKSNGSIILTGNLNSFKLNADSAISINVKNIVTNSEIVDLTTTTLSLGVGYTYTIVYHSFFLNGALSLGPAHNWIIIQNPDGSNKYDIAMNTYNDIRLALGYNSDKIFGGLSAVVQSRNIRFENSAFTNTSTSMRLVLGYRFEEKGILKKKVKDYIPAKF